MNQRLNIICPGWLSWFQPNCWQLQASWSWTHLKVVWAGSSANFLLSKMVWFLQNWKAGLFLPPVRVPGITDSRLSLLICRLMILIISELPPLFGGLNEVAYLLWDISGGASGKECFWQCRICKSCSFNPWVGKILWSRKWQPTPVFLPEPSGHCVPCVTVHASPKTRTHIHTHIHTDTHPVGESWFILVVFEWVNAKQCDERTEEFEFHSAVERFALRHLLINVHFNGRWSSSVKKWSPE